MVVGLVVLATVGFGLILSFHMLGKTPSDAADTANVWALLLTYTGFVVAWIASTARWALARSRTSRVDEIAENRLRREVALHVSGATSKPEFNPRPIRLRWKRTNRPVMVAGSPAVAGSHPDPFSGELSVDVPVARPSAWALAALIRDSPQSIFVVLGEPGAGKTTLATQLISAFIEAYPNDLVPIFLSVAGWDPRKPLDDWLVRRVGEDYLGVVSEPEVRRLLSDRKVLPVLDGLDELFDGASTDLHQSVLRQLEEVGVRLVVTCRGEDYERATSMYGPLVHAAVLEIEPLDPSDAAAFLPQREVEGSDRWRPVVDQVRSGRGTLASVMRTPLMPSLARAAFASPDTDPGELLGFASAADVREDLLNRFLQSAFRSSRRSRRAKRWLGYLARHLDDPRSADPNIRWWHIARTVPPSTMIILSSFLAAFLGVALGLLAQAIVDPMRSNVAQVVIASAVAGSAVGVVIGRNIARSTLPNEEEPTGRTLFWITIREIAGDVVAAVATLSTLGALVLTVAHLTNDTKTSASFGVLESARQLIRGDARFLVMILLTVLAFVGIAILTNGLGHGRIGIPRRGVPGLRSLVNSLGVGFAAGAAVLATLGAPWMLVGLREDVDPLIGLMTSAALAAIVGLSLAVGRWLSAPLDIRSQVSPGSVLRSDLLSLGATTACTVAIATGVAVLVLSFGGIRADVAWKLSVIIGAFAGAVVFLGSGSAWLSYTVARLWLAVWRYMPWFLMRFLRDAHRQGVLRQAGASYQVRHELLREHILRGPELRLRPYVVRMTSPARVVYENEWLRHRHTYVPDQSIWRRLAHYRTIFVLRCLALLASIGYTTAIRRSVLFVACLALPVAALALDPRDSHTVIPPITSVHTPTYPAVDGGTDVSRIAFNSVGDRIAVVRGDRNEVEIRQISDGVVVRRIPTTDVPARVWFGLGDRTLFASYDAGPVERVEIRAVGSGKYITSLLGSDGSYGATYSPGYDRMVTTSAEGVSVLWDVPSARLNTLLREAGPPARVAFSSDGDKLAIGQMDGTVHLWDTLDGQYIAKLKGHAGTILDMSFSPDATRLATAGGDRTVRVWDLRAPSQQLMLEGNFLSVAFNSSGQELAAGGFGGNVKTWDKEGDLIASFKGHTSSVMDVAFSDNDALLATVSVDGTARTWNARTGDERMLFRTPVLDLLRGRSPYEPRPIKGLVISPSGTRLATYEDNGPVRIWNMVTGDLLHEIDAAALSIDYDHEGRHLMTTGADGVVRSWSTVTGQLSETIAKPIGRVTTMARNDRLFSVRADGTAHLWNTSNQTMLATLGEEIVDVLVPENGDAIVSLSADNYAQAWNVLTGRPLAGYHLTEGPALKAVLSGDGRFLGVIDGRGSAFLVSTATGNRFVVGAAVEDISFGAHGGTLAVLHRYGVVKIWSASDGSIISTLRNQTNIPGVVFLVRGLATDPTGTTLATVNTDGTVRLWDGETGSPLSSLPYPGDAITGLTFSKNGRVLIVATASTVQLHPVSSS